VCVLRPPYGRLHVVDAGGRVLRPPRRRLRAMNAGGRGGAGEQGCTRALVPGGGCCVALAEAALVSRRGVVGESGAACPGTDYVRRRSLLA